MKRRHDLLKKHGEPGGIKPPEGIEVIQLTADEKQNASHIYMEAQIFFPDSKRFILHRSGTAHGGSDKNDPGHRYLLCDTENRCSLEPVTEETGATCPAVSPDGRYFYYFVDETEINKGRLTLKRIDFNNGRQKETLTVIDRPFPATGTRPGRIYPLATISSDGKKIGVQAFFGNGKKDNAPWGLMVFDTEKAGASLILHGQTWCNMHPQYCRSRDANFKRDILVQENHGNICDREGRMNVLFSGRGADIHVIRDDGTNFRTMPWGRDGNEFCVGHECWRGREEWAISSVWYQNAKDVSLFESMPVEDINHEGLNTPGGRRNNLSKNFKKPCFSHFATDAEGRLIVSDYNKTHVFLGRLQEPGESPVANWTYLVNSCSSGSKKSHIHPFLSPDGKKVFFNSDETGTLQAYMVNGIENVRI